MLRASRAGGNRTVKPWYAEEIASLRHMRDFGHMSFQDIGQKLGRTTNACKSKYSAPEMVRVLSCDAIDPAENSIPRRISPEQISDRDARYQLWLEQPATAQLM